MYPFPGGSTFQDGAPVARLFMDGPGQDWQLGHPTAPVTPRYTATKLILVAAKRDQLRWHCIPSLKLTFSHLKMDGPGWKTIRLFFLGWRNLAGAKC